MSLANARRTFLLAPISAAILLTYGSAGYAASTVVTTATTAAKSLAANDTLTVTSTGSMTIGGSTVAVTVTGNNATITNLGSIKQTGTGRVIRDNTGVTGLTITNGSTTNSTALMQSADADVVQMNKSPAGVALYNYGTMTSLNASKGGAQVIDFEAIKSGTNSVFNFATGVMKAYEADAVRTGVNGTVYNAGQIISVTSTGASSDGIDMQTNSGAVITNTGSGLIEGGRHGITGGVDSTQSPTGTFTTVVSNAANATIKGDNGSGINIDGFNGNEVVFVTNNGLISGNGVTGDGDGIDVDGIANITNYGTIRSINAYSASSTDLAYSEGVTIGGGTVDNYGTIEGLVNAGNTNAVGRGITFAGNDITSGPLAGTREGLYGNAVVNNYSGGLIRGQSDSAIAVDGAGNSFTVTINNSTGGTIRGGGTTAAAIRTGANNDTINNSGLIDGSSSGKAIAMGAGNNTLNITGGSAEVRGDIDGGSGGTNRMKIDPGSGNAFAYGGAISNFSSVEVSSGTVTLSGANTYTGTTKLSGGTLVLDGANRLASASSLALNGGSLSIVNASGLAQSFSDLSLGANSTIDLHGTSLSFAGLSSVTSGATLTVLNALGINTALSFSGNLTGNATFLALVANTTINGLGAVYNFNGVSTTIAAVPEPATMTLLFGGLGLLGLAARRRRANWA